MEHDRNLALPRLLKTFALLAVLAGAGCQKETAAPEPAVAARDAGPTLYRVTFEASWSAATHANFPVGAHFSPLMGASHRAEELLFQPGRLASTGIQNMAERGNNTALRAEIAAWRGDGRALGLLDGRGSTASPGQLADTVRLDAGHPLLTVVTMIAPSPDWFVALENENMLGADGQWATLRTVAARTYDAGTDSGPAFTSPDHPTRPAAPVVLLRLPPATSNAADGPPLGMWRVERIK
ncbi:spondin domain-containing protein [Hymenobacter sp. B1770]|uniref:spondin domain-containing protein n=1 Tax=Hymenobacter sp. B1770 TaxID=1718788 RepID=UPI003CF10FF6